ncbi:MAG: type II and III secretion system protein [Oligoflexia bacterium]|nr:type II and III secretion system protein [Oligoflexia bacterium]
MSKGEIRTIRVGVFDNFAIGNKEILSAKAVSKRPGNLLIKAKMKGYSQIKFFKNQKLIRSFAFYVISKQRQMSFISLKKKLKKKELVKLKGDEIILQGEIDNLNDFFEVTKFLKHREINHQLTLKEKFKKRLLSNIYYYFIKNNYDDVECEVENLAINCFFQDYDKELFDYLKKKYSILFIKNQSYSKIKHYKIMLKLIQFENTSSKEFRLGLDKIEGNIGIFLNTADDLYTNNTILLNNKNITYSTLAKPEITIRENKKVEISIGSEIPYQIGSNQSGFQQQWRFAGLKIKMNLQRIGDHHIIDYETNFSRPMNNNVISGNKQMSSISLKANKATKLFNIGFTSSAEEESSLPYLSKVPLLGKLFTSQGGVETYKKVIGIIMIEELP